MTKMMAALFAGRRMRSGLAFAACLIGATAVHAAGSDVFAAHCATCHMANAQGSPGFVPPLTETLGHYAQTPAGRALLARIVAYGMSGTITVAGQRYVGSMAVVRPLTDAEVAEALNHVLTQFNQASLPKDFQPFTEDEVKQHRAEKSTPVANYAARQALVSRLTTEGKGR
ncbi:MAG TPA: cytochrome c [Burkholderiaceae bacterium]|nr:cytochrome c [Burkholderiaceae bacterium]